MPVDNQEIMDKIDALKAKGWEYRDKMKEIQIVIEELQDICEEDDPDNPPNKKPIIDKGTGSVMAQARRQSVFDSQLTKADSLLV